MTQKQTVDGANTETETYVWTPDGYLASATLDSGETVAYEYDHRGERVRRTLTDDTAQVVDDTHYLVDSMNPTGYSQVLAEIDIDPATGDRTVSRYNTIGDRLLAQTEITGGTGAGARTPVYLATDGLGSVRSAQTSHQEILAQSEAYDYTAFGSPHGSQTRSLTNYAFTGQYRDSETDLQYHRARWLNTNQGQWLSQDPYFDFPGNYGGIYSYSQSNPVSYSDLTGKFTLLETLSINSIVSELVLIDLGAAYNIFNMQGGEVAEVGTNFVLFILKNMGFTALGYLPVIGVIVGIFDLLYLVKYAAEEVLYLIRTGSLTATKLAVVFGVLLTLAVTAKLLKRTPKEEFRIALASMDDAASSNYISRSPVHAGVGGGPTRMRARDIRFTQKNCSNYFSDNYGKIEDLVTKVNKGGDTDKAIQVTKYKGEWYSYDNRRLAAYKIADGDIPVTVFDQKSDPKLYKQFLDRQKQANPDGSIIVYNKSTRKHKDAIPKFTVSHDGSVGPVK